MKPTGTHEIHNIALHWREWFRNRQYDIAYQDEIMGLFNEQVQRLKGDEFKRMSDVFAEMEEERWENFRKALAIQQSSCPIGFFKPSWEQAQILNAWSPEYDPDKAPGGYRTILDFTTNQRGKSTGMLVNMLLWLIPSDPDWEMYQWQEDVEGQKHGADRGRYRVFWRPNFDAWHRTGKLIPCHKSDPPKSNAENWIGVEDDNHWKDKTLKEIKKWLPMDCVDRRGDGTAAIWAQERRIDLKNGNSITAKTYNGDPQSWGGKSVWSIMMDEGPPKAIFDEAAIRVNTGFFTWAYTVVEARNIGERAKLAHDVYHNKDNAFHIVGQHKVFEKFTMDMIPDWIMDPQKKRDNIERLSKAGGMGKVRMGIQPFFESSPRVFAHFDREQHVLPWSGLEVMAAMRGDGDEKLVNAFRQANVIRGFDEGTAHPTTCAWIAILRTGEYVCFREFSEPGLSITERCVKIIEASRNEREVSHYHAEETLRRYVEKKGEKGLVIRRTFADSKIFKRDPDSPKDDWVAKYRNQGLRMERASSIGPAARCDSVNDMFLADQTRQHLGRKTVPGYRLYLTVDCERMIERLENYLHGQFLSGPNKGGFTGKPDTFGDDEIDGLCYACTSGLKWRDPNPPAVSGVRYDRLTGAVLR